MPDSSSQIPESLKHYLLMWNELNPDDIRGHLDRAVSDDCLWVDPQHSHIGRDALEENVRGFHSKYGSAELSLASNVDGHNSRYRYEWEITLNGQILIHGFDVATLNSDGQIERVDGFFGRLKPLE
ncbi:MAG: hypothetical protein ACI91G_000688 [Gammaproteobacteria bacterium]|jgi:hypothetical protein